MAELRYHVERQQQQLSDVAKVEQQVQALSQQKEDYHTNLVSHQNYNYILTIFLWCLPFDSSRKMSILKEKEHRCYKRV